MWLGLEVSTSEANLALRFLAWLVVAAASFVGGGFAIPIGLSLGLSVLEVYLTATVGSMLGLVVFMFAGDKVLTRVGAKRSAGADEDSAVRRLANRYGPRGLGLIGPLFPGVSASVVVGLALGMNKAALARWLAIGIAVMFALYCAGLWLLIEFVGLG